MLPINAVLAKLYQKAVLKSRGSQKSLNSQNLIVFFAINCRYIKC